MRATCALLLLVVGACVPARGGWDVAALEAGHPELATLRGQRLGDATPFLLPDGDELALFLCRWPGDAAISVSLPPDASETERASLRAALRAWESALGLRFEEPSRGRAQIEIRFVGSDEATGPDRRSADTIADCLASSRPGPTAAPLEAQMVFASIHLRRSQVDLRGRAHPLSPEELVGVALHELGHALGYSGHAALGGTVMVRDVDHVKDRGRQVHAGKRFDDATLAALYALPSGTQVGRLPLASEPRALYERLALQLADEDGWIGPQIRVGDRMARIFWSGPDGEQVVLRIPDPRALPREPRRLHLIPNAAARRRLSP